jgi:hypothetical protein
MRNYSASRFGVVRARARRSLGSDRTLESAARAGTCCDRPTIRAALVAGTPWLNVFYPGCGTSRAIDLRTVDGHPLASVGTLVPRLSPIAQLRHCAMTQPRAD